MSDTRQEICSKIFQNKMATWSNFECQKWMKGSNASCLCQEQLKMEAMLFSDIFDNVGKKTISKIVEDFEKERKQVLTDASHLIFEEMGGQEGKRRGRKDIPPKDYFPKDQTELKMIKVKENMQTECEMCDILLSTNMAVMNHMQNKHADALKKAFSKEVLRRVESHRKYLDWLKKDHIIVNIMTSNHKDMNKEQVKEVAENHDESCFKITKDRTSGSDIIETKRTIIVPQRNGTERKTVVKYQLANITTRTRESENDDKSELGKRKHSEAERKQAKKITNILVIQASKSILLA